MILFPVISYIAMAAATDAFSESIGPS